MFRACAVHAAHNDNDCTSEIFTLRTYTIHTIYGTYSTSTL